MKDFLSGLYSLVLIGIICYISGWLMFIKPLINTFLCDTVNGGMVVGVILKVVFALPVARLIYMLGIKTALKIFQ